MVNNAKDYIFDPFNAEGKLYDFVNKNPGGTRVLISFKRDNRWQNSR